MSTPLPRIDFPEIFLGFVAPIGADLDPTIEIFKEYFRSEGYRVVQIKITDLFLTFEPFIKPKVPLQRSPLYERFNSYISYGNQLRAHFNDNATLAAAAVQRVIRKRLALQQESGDATFQKTVFLLYQFKRKEEVELLRSVYGKLFFQVSAYSRRGARVESLARRFAASENEAQSSKYRPKAEEIVQRDADESEEKHGQRVSKIFHDADFIVNLDAPAAPLAQQIKRFCEILFSSNSFSPTKLEYGMFTAKAAAMRTLDLSRQVGAAIFSENGELISLGSNEVPKANGGTYWSDGKYDARDYVWNHDPNVSRKNQILTELIKLLGLEKSKDEIISRPEVRSSQFMDALEYSRVVHAEMCAICDAARLGRVTKGGILFCTTFPCHMCAKHIIAAGISKVIFLEPYPKSLASELHPDSLMIEGADRGQYSCYPAVVFEHFFGITPRRYRELFERGARKNDKGEFQPYIENRKIPCIDVKFPQYSELEVAIEKLALKNSKAVGMFKNDDSAPVL